MTSASTLAIGLLSAVAALSLAWAWRAHRRAVRGAVERADTSETDGLRAELADARRSFDVLRRRERLTRVRADECERELASLAYSVSHDLRTPLRGINGFCQALTEDYGSRLDATARDYLRRVQANGAYMHALVDDLLSLSQVARAPFSPERIDVSALALGIVRELTATDPARPVRWEVAPTLVAVADAPLLTEALRHLLGNAWKFTSARDVATIAVGVLASDPARPAGTVYQVRDNGVGFDPRYAGKLFGAFQRMHTPEEFPATGRGIGLALVQRIVHRHGGRIWAESSPKQGSTFSFTLESDGVGTVADEFPEACAPAPWPQKDGAADAPIRKTTTV